MEYYKTKQHITGTKAIAYCALFVALITVLSQLIIPLAPIPISLGLFGVLICGTILGRKLGVISVVIYIIMGLCGLPVFAGFVSSPAILGPTGGYIIGYILAVFIAGFGGKYAQKNSIIMFGLLALAVLACYAMGTAWYMVYASVNFYGALFACVIPFLLGDAIKIITAGLLSIRLTKSKG